ncbi:MAG: response regulator transcription factor [Anaerolineae bacterium]|nr:response regulator transcription factor [Anaerolineae bacterium]
MNDRPNILIADDDPTITNSLTPFFERAGFHVLTANNGVDAFEKAQTHQPDLIVLDVLMPRLDGREVLRRLRRKGLSTPTILLTHVGDALERALALEEGADDYLNKPFEAHELLARVKAILRRSKNGQASLSTSWRLAALTLVVDRRARRATLDDKILELSPKAFAVLEYLITHPNEVVSRERLLQLVWGWEYPAGTRTVDTRMFELRKSLGDDPADPKYIETQAGEGYCFIAPVRMLP